MKTLARLIFVITALLVASSGQAQDSALDDAEQLKIAAIEALIAAPVDRALPLVNKVLAGNHSVELKERALFILSQINADAAQKTLLDFARNTEGELQYEAIRMIGISGNSDSLTTLRSIYENGNADAREAVLEAFMIAGNKQAVFDIAVAAEGDDFEEAVEMLAVMGARDELRQLRSTKGTSEALIEACAISGDFECVREQSLDDSDPDLQAEAIEAMGIIGGEEVNATLVQIYRDAKTDDIREAALDGMMISGNNAGLLELYRSSNDSALKRELLEYLVMTGSDEIWDIIDAALDGNQ